MCCHVAHVHGLLLLAIDIMGLMRYAKMIEYAWTS